jgi:hypothetical protein
MATCNFCKEDRFQSEQGVKAHMKTCERYLAEKAKKARAASGACLRQPRRRISQRQSSMW